MVSAQAGSEISTAETFSSAALSEISNLEDALRLLSDSGVTIVEASDLGDGFAVQKDKNALVDIPFLILENREHLGNFGPFTIATCIKGDGTKFIMVDGGAGIHAQLTDMRERGISRGIMCRNGLVRSDYDYPSTDRKTGEVTLTPATTYYINTAA